MIGTYLCGKKNWKSDYLLAASCTFRIRQTIPYRPPFSRIFIYLYTYRRRGVRTHFFHTGHAFVRMAKRIISHNDSLCVATALNRRSQCETTCKYVVFSNEIKIPYLYSGSIVKNRARETCRRSKCVFSSVSSRAFFCIVMMLFRRVFVVHAMHFRKAVCSTTGA